LGIVIEDARRQRRDIVLTQDSVANMSLSEATSRINMNMGDPDDIKRQLNSFNLILED
jgi:hypothetical protein